VGFSIQRGKGGEIYKASKEEKSPACPPPGRERGEGRGAVVIQKESH